MQGHADRDRQLFDRIAERYCRKDLRPASRAARRLRLEQTVRAAGLSPECRVLDVGCGAGFAATYLRGRYREYVGIDHSPKLIECATSLNDLPAAHFVARSVEDLDVCEPFDVVVAIGVLHHLDDMASVLARLRALLKPGGRLAANEPQRGNPLIGLARRLRKRLDREYSPDQRVLTAGEIAAALRDAGFERIRVRPQGLASTPFAEVVCAPQWLAAPLAHLACAADRVVEPALAIAPWVAWNLVCTARRPDSG